MRNRASSIALSMLVPFLVMASANASSKEDQLFSAGAESYAHSESSFLLKVALNDSFPVKPHLAFDDSFPVKPHLALNDSFPVKPHLALNDSFPVKPHVAALGSGVLA